MIAACEAEGEDYAEAEDGPDEDEGEKIITFDLLTFDDELSCSLTDDWLVRVVFFIGFVVICDFPE